MKSFFSLLKPTRKPVQAPRAQRQAQPGLDQRDAFREEVVTLSLRDVLVRSRVPSEWVAVELVPAVARAGAQRQSHVRLVLHQWDDRLVQSLVQIERGFVRRLLLLAPRSSEWVCDVSWRFALQRPPGNEASSVGTLAPALPKEAPAPAAKTDNREALLDPERERLYASRSRGHADFSPTEPMF